MADQADFVAGPEQTTGKYIVTFRDEALTEGLSMLRKSSGVGRLPSAADFTESAIDAGQMESAGGAVFPTLGIAVVSLDEEGLAGLLSAQTDDSAVMDVEPESIFYALGDVRASADYLRGYRDAVNQLVDKAIGEPGGDRPDGVDAEAAYFDDAQSTWGVKAVRASTSRYTGRGIKVAVLDTGLDLQHPDFRGRTIVHRSFISGESVQDGNGHGTHCIGTACGFRDVNGRRYGVARGSSIYAGKVLSNAGSGATSGIIAGMEWAITSGCQVISMSLGNTNPNPSTAYETAGRRALQNGSLVVAAAGNHGPTGTVGQPANSPSIMAVAAVDNRLRTAGFSCRSGTASGASVDIAGPGVAVYSTWPMSRRYHTINGTSMATPHVAGVAALYAEAFRGRGAALWQMLTSRALRLPQSAREVGAGLVQAPQ